MNLPAEFDTKAISDQIEEAMQAGKLTASAVENLKVWLTEDRYQAYVPQIIEHIIAGKWQALDDVFWTVIPFGTGGRRGMMYPFGSNAINDRTIGESAQGLADYVNATMPDKGSKSAAIAYDTRHKSREFAELCASVLVANGFEVYFIDDYRSTPELSYLIRYKQCDCGIMVTASHNPPSDNAVKVYWSNGAQLIPPHDKGVIGKVNQVDVISKVSFEQAVADGKIHLICEEVDQALKREHFQQSFEGPRDLSIIYSPLHGVGEFNVKSVLNGIGFETLEIFEPHRKPDGDFPNVPNHVSNPENAAVFDAMIVRGQKIKADLILATDPDCDRMGAAAPVTLDSKGEWDTFNGNQLAVMLCEYVLRKRKEQQSLTSDHYIVSTLVTTRMLRQICQHYGVACLDENLVGFKWICDVVDQQGPERFVYGAEESHGYLVGQYCRDKDGAVACMLMSELAAEVKAKGKSLFEHLDSLFLTYGYHQERLVSIKMAGSDGMARMEQIMARFRSDTPKNLGGLTVTALRDYSVGKRFQEDGTEEPMEGPVGNLLIFETEKAGNYVAARPSGTEPKIKFYMFTCVSADYLGSLDGLAEAKEQMTLRLDGYAKDMQAFADSCI